MTMKIAWGAKVAPEFKALVVEIAVWLVIDPSWLMSWMAFESAGTFAPDVRNAHSSAVGLIQFMRRTARDLGTSSEALARMTAVQQLAYVRLYFKPWRGKLRTLSDGYMVILWPKAVGKPESYVLWKNGAPAYAVNKGLDIDKDGAVTKAEAASKIYQWLAEGMKPGNIG